MPSRPHVVKAILHASPAVVLLLALTTCGGDPPSLNAPPPISGSGVTIVPGVLDLKPGSTQLLQARVFDTAGKPVASPSVQWTTTNASVATVTSAGMVTGISVGTAGVIAAINGVSDTATVRVAPEPPTGAFIDVYPEVTYQEMTGWEGTAQIGEVECNPTAFTIYRQEVVDRLVNELGINRVRLHVRSGHENPQDFYTTYRNSHQSSDWNPHRYQSVNDNDDPRVARTAGFQFAEIDHKVEVIIQPMQAALAARGERLFVNLNYVDFGVSSWEQSSDPEEYAELIHMTFLHLKDRYGWVPDAVEVSLEPDNTPNWNPQTIGRALVAAGDRLKAAGFQPAFIAPSNTSMSSALSYFDQMLATPRVLEYLTDVAYHRYSGVSAATLAAIAARATEHGLRTAMLEHIGSGYDDLHQDLRDGLNSAWQQFTLAYCNSQDTGGNYYRIDESVPTSPKVILASRSRYFRQYFPFIRLNARGSGVQWRPRLDPLAFRNTNGKVVAVIRATEGGPVQLRRLPTGAYGVTYTTATQSFVSLADIAVGQDGTLQVTMPSAGVITIHER
jgi:hypothetical protein